jgi:hypothetical protein
MLEHHWNINKRIIEKGNKMELILQKMWK